ncbi:VOC family protein [Nocardia macrotermitis]|uniref:VOC family protein n=1 Tax=Nocardia macrotermitis TaxID=2585198 RepID=UPI001295E01D|nr:VOC family protein [Nocardia macrotermitis]
MAGEVGGVDHIGFSVADSPTLDRILINLEAAGDKVHRRFRESTNADTAFITDIDGYLLQLTAGDPARP